MHHTEYMASTGTDPQATMPSPIFPGVVEDLKLTGGLLSSPVTYRTGLNENWWDFVYFPLPLLDLAPSLVLDVLWLPSDIIYWINH